MTRQGFELRNVPLLSRVGADRADALRTDVDAAVAGWPDALLLRVDRRNQVLISGGQVVLGNAAKLGVKPPENAVFLGRLATVDMCGRFAPRWRAPTIRTPKPRCSTCAVPGRSSTT